MIKFFEHAQAKCAVGILILDSWSVSRKASTDTAGAQSLAFGSRADFCRNTAHHMLLSSGRTSQSAVCDILTWHILVIRPES